MNTLITIIRNWSERGVRLPYAYDAISEKPSITLLFLWLYSVALLISIINMHVNAEPLTAGIFTATVWALSTIFYMLRKLTSAKVDLDDKSFELENSSPGENIDETK